jgi:hypothetical protein
MCQWSEEIELQTRPAREEALVTTHFGLGLIGLADEEGNAVCVAPGTELAFDGDLEWASGTKVYGRGYRLARLRHDPTEAESRYRDKLVLADGREVYVNALAPGQRCVVLQLPVGSKTVAAEVEAEGV